MGRGPRAEGYGPDGEESEEKKNRLGFPVSGIRGHGLEWVGQ